MDLDAFIQSTEKVIREGQQFLAGVKKECPICFDDSFDATFVTLECSPHHVVCMTCYSKIDRCVMCRVPFQRPIYNFRHGDRSIFNNEIIQIHVDNVPSMGAQWNLQDILELINYWLGELPRRVEDLDPRRLITMMKVLNTILGRHNFYIEDIHKGTEHVVRYSCSVLEGSVYTYNHITTDVKERRILKNAMSRLVAKMRSFMYAMNIQVVM